MYIIVRLAVYAIILNFYTRPPCTIIILTPFLSQLLTYSLLI